MDSFQNQVRTETGFGITKTLIVMYIAQNVCFFAKDILHIHGNVKLGF